jgi:CHASE2 domain-containing sensor protein
VVELLGPDRFSVNPDRRRPEQPGVRGRSPCVMRGRTLRAELVAPGASVIGRATMRLVAHRSQRDFRLAGLVGSCLGAVGLVLLVLRHSWVGAILIAAALAVLMAVTWTVRRGPQRREDTRRPVGEAGP